MKRIISLLLSTLMLVSVLYIPKASAKEVEFAGTYDEAVAVLSHIGIVSDLNTENGGNAYSVVTRAKFAELVAKALNLKSTTDMIYFSDVKSDHRAYTYINALVESNILSLADDNKFNPEDAVTYEQAMKILVCALGYGYHAESNGGFPGGYIMKAQQLKLLKDVTVGDEVKYGDAVMMLFNAVTTEMSDIEKISTDNISYAKSDKTILSVYWNIYKSEGYLTEYYGGSMNSREVEKDEVYVDDTKYKILNTINPNKYFANYVEYFYEEKNDTKTVIYLQNDESNNDGRIIDSEHYVSFSSDQSSIKYYDNNYNSTRDISFERTAKVIFNGMPYTGSLTQLFADYFDNKSHRGTIYITSNNSSAKNVVVINAYRAFVIGDIDSNGKVYNKYNNADILDIEKLTYVNFYDTDNSMIENNIASNNVYTAAVSQDGKCASFVYHRTPTVTGAVSGIMGDGKIVVDSNSYDVDKSVFNSISMPKIGNDCELYVDEFGYVIYIKENNGNADMRVAYLMQLSTPNLLDTTIKIKLLDQDNKILTLESCEKLIVDRIKYESADIGNNPSIAFADSTLVSGRYVVNHQIIRYRTDADGAVKEIDTAVQSEKEKDNEGYTLTKYKDNPYEKMFEGLSKKRKTVRYCGQGGKALYRLDSNIIFTQADSIMFNVPLTDAEGYLMHNPNYTILDGNLTDGREYTKDENGNKIKAEDYMYSVGFKGMVSGYSYFADAYDYDKDKPYAECIVNNYPVAEIMTNVQLVKEFSEGIDSQGEVTSFITLMSGASEVSYSIEEGLLKKGTNNEIKPGDVVRTVYDSARGRVYELTKVYDSTTDKIIPYSTSTSSTSYENWAAGYANSANITYMIGRQLTKGRVLKRTDSVLYVDWNNDFEYDEIVETKGASIIVCDKNNEKSDQRYTTGSISDIRDFESSGDDFSEVLVSSNVGTIVNVFVIK